MRQSGPPGDGQPPQLRPGTIASVCAICCKSMISIAGRDSLRIQRFAAATLSMNYQQLKEKSKKRNRPRMDLGQSSDLRSHCAAPCTASKYVPASDMNSPDAVASLARPLSLIV